MPATTTPRRPIAAALGFVMVAVAPGAALVAPTVSAAAPAGVTVTMSSDKTGTPNYRITVHNETAAAVDTTVRQDLPLGAGVESVSGGGRAMPADATGTEITWQLHLPAHGTTTLRTALDPAPADVALAAPACAFVAGSRNGSEGGLAYDCATAIWGQAPDGDAAAWWQRPWVIIGALVALLTLAAVGWWWMVRRRCTGHRRAPGDEDTPPPPVPAGEETQPHSPDEPEPRRAPPTWRVVSFAAALLVGMIAVIMWIGGTQVAAFGPNAESTSGAWVGTATTGKIGIPLREATFEFTVYRLTCTPDDQPARRRCRTMIGLRNITESSQMWYGGMQRAYLPTGTWVNTDEPATREANGGQDIFAHPIPGGGQLLAPLVFTMTGAEAPTKIELRSAVFSAGVTVVP